MGAWCPICAITRLAVAHTARPTKINKKIFERERKKKKRRRQKQKNTKNTVVQQWKMYEIFLRTPWVYEYVWCMCMSVLELLLDSRRACVRVFVCMSFTHLRTIWTAGPISMYTKCFDVDIQLWIWQSNKTLNLSRLLYEIFDRNSSLVSSSIR